MRSRRKLRCAVRFSSGGASVGFLAILVTPFPFAQVGRSQNSRPQPSCPHASGQAPHSYGKPHAATTWVRGRNGPIAYNPRDVSIPWFFHAPFYSTRHVMVVELMKTWLGEPGVQGCMRLTPLGPQRFLASFCTIPEIDPSLCILPMELSTPTLDRGRPLRRSPLRRSY
jgi:hypothetical protein